MSDHRGVVRALSCAVALTVLLETTSCAGAQPVTSPVSVTVASTGTGTVGPWPSRSSPSAPTASLSTSAGAKNCILEKGVPGGRAKAADIKFSRPKLPSGTVLTADQTIAKLARQHISAGYGTVYCYLVDYTSFEQHNAVYLVWAFVVHDLPVYAAGPHVPTPFTTPFLEDSALLADAHTGAYLEAFTY